MYQIPPQMTARYEQLLLNSDIPSEQYRYYRKWVRYYWDFSHKYTCEAANPKTLARFLEKLHSKKQSQSQQEQAQKAILLFYQLESVQPTAAPTRDNHPSAKPMLAKHPEKEINPASIYQALTTQIKTRHYSPKTLKAYLPSVPRFYTRQRPFFSLCGGCQ
jgi:hypothetical protein